MALSMHRHCCVVGPDDFRPWVLSELRKQIPFDSAVWVAAATAEAVRSAPYACYLHNQPENLRRDELLLTPMTILSRRAIRVPGETVSIPIHWSSCGRSALFFPFMDRYDIAYASLTVVVDPVTRLFVAVALCRNIGGAPFHEEECLFLRALMPHMVETWSTNRLLALHREGACSGENVHATAIVNQELSLQVCGNQFADLLRSEWPDWEGPFVPSALTKIARHEKGRHVGGTIVVHACPVKDEILLRARRRTGFDCLGRRELEVATRFAAGNTQKEIARELSLSPSTVSNHLVNVYEKLAVRNKAQLVRIFAKYE